MDVLLSVNHVDHVQRDSFAPPARVHALQLVGQRRLATSAPDAKGSLSAAAVITPVA